MRRLGGVCLLVAGLLSVLAGAVLAVAFGPDDRLGTGPHRLSSEASVITTAPHAIVYAGPEVELTVTSRGGARDLFVGVGHHVDVVDLLADTRRTRVERIDLPWEVSTSTVGGSGSPRAAPTEVDWWYAQATGDGAATISWTLPEDGGDVVIADLAGRDGLTVDITAAVLVPGVFVVGAAMLVIGVGIAVLGWAVLTSGERPRRRAANRGDHDRGRDREGVG